MWKKIRSKKDLPNDDRIVFFVDKKKNRYYGRYDHDYKTWIDEADHGGSGHCKNITHWMELQNLRQIK